MKIIASYFQINTTFIRILLEQSYNLTRTTKNTVATFYPQMRTDTRNALLIIREKQLQSPDMMNNTSNKMYLHEHTTKFYTIRQNYKIRNSIYISIVSFILTYSLIRQNMNELLYVIKHEKNKCKAAKAEYRSRGG